MPTAYTAILGEREDMKLKDFAMLCARNFGVLIEMRDDPLTAPIPERLEVDKLYKENYDKAVKAYNDFMALSDSGKAEYLERDYNKAVEGYLQREEKRLKEIGVLRQRYEKMLSKISKWAAPTPEYKNLRAFMIKQIQDSIEFDCSEHHISIPDKKTWCDIDRYKLVLAKNVAFFKGRYESQVKAVAEKNKWLSDLIESLKDCD